jgi:hypothetical protein
VRGYSQWEWLDGAVRGRFAKRARAGLDDACEGSIEFAFIPGVHEYNFLSDRAARLLHFARFIRNAGTTIGGTDQLLAALLSRGTLAFAVAGEIWPSEELVKWPRLLARSSGGEQIGNAAGREPQ